MSGVDPNSSAFDPSGEMSFTGSESLFLLLEQLVENSRENDAEAIEDLIKDCPQDIEIEKHLDVIRRLKAIRAASVQNLPELSLPYQIRDYQLVEEIGRGGMGAVYLGIREDLNSRYAIKTFYLKAESQGNYQREAAILAKLHHPHIVPLVDFGVQENLVYLVMRRVEGISLAEFSRLFHEQNREDESPEKWKYLGLLMLQIARAVAHAHSEGIIHRDIKPGNILVDHDSNAWLTDFGLSTTTVATGKLWGGTLGYMPPEQFAGKSNRRTDIFAFGVTLLELVTGLRRNSERFQDITNGGNLDARNLAASFPHIPFQLIKIISRCTARSPALRYQDMDDLIPELNEFVFGYDRKPKRRLVDFVLMAMLALCIWGASYIKWPQKNYPPVFPPNLTKRPLDLTVCQDWGSIPLVGISGEDPEGDPIYYQVSGGKDQERFFYDNALGELFFTSHRNSQVEDLNIQLSVSNQKPMEGFYIHRHQDKVLVHDFDGKVICEIDQERKFDWQRLLGLASSDGDTVFMALENDEAVTLQKAKFSMESGWFKSFETIHPNCGLPPMTEALETMDGRLFYVFYKEGKDANNFQIHLLAKMELQDDGTFVSLDRPIRIPVIGDIRQARFSSPRTMAIFCTEGSDSSFGQRSSECYSLRLAEPITARSFSIRRQLREHNARLDGTSWVSKRQKTIRSAHIDLKIRAVPRSNWLTMLPSHISEATDGKIRIMNHSDSLIRIVNVQNSQTRYDHFERSGSCRVVAEVGPMSTVTLDRLPGITREVYGPRGELWDVFFDNLETSKVDIEGPREVRATYIGENPQLRRAIARGFEEGDYVAADQTLVPYLAAFPNDYNAWKLQLFDRLSLYDIRRATDIVNRLLDGGCNDPVIFEIKGELLRLSGKMDLAESEFYKLIDRYGEKVHGYLGLARIHFNRGDLTEARKFIDEALDMDPGNPRVYTHLFVLARFSKNKAQSARYRAKCKKLAETAIQKRHRKSFAYGVKRLGEGTTILTEEYLEIFALNILPELSRIPANAPNVVSKPVNSELSDLN